MQNKNKLVFGESIETNIKNVTQHYSLGIRSQAVFPLYIGLYVAGCMKISAKITKRDSTRKEFIINGSDAFFTSTSAGLAAAPLVLIPAMLGTGFHVMLNSFIKVRNFFKAANQLRASVKFAELDGQNFPSGEIPPEDIQAVTKSLVYMNVFTTNFEGALNANGFS